MNQEIEAVNYRKANGATEYFFKKYNRHLEAATEAFNAGEFTSKAAQKKAIESLAHCFDSVSCLDGTNGVRYRAWEASGSEGKFLDTPYSLHHIREKHAPCYSPLNWQVVKALFAMREAIKGMEINKPNKAVTFASKTRVRIEKSLLEILKLRETQFAHGVKLVEIFGRLRVYGNTHYCVNQHGTCYTRTFWYMNHTLTPLNVILCVLEATKKEEKE
ncbi:MAG: hypothetical protein HRT88_18320 [Lentisphaeraceae bacterium]|nr:hypothetical protein [Lentisphaeraceae bacterium]